MCVGRREGRVICFRICTSWTCEETGIPVWWTALHMSQLAAIALTVSIFIVNSERDVSTMNRGKPSMSNIWNHTLFGFSQFPTLQSFLLLFYIIGEDRPEKQAAGGHLASCMLLRINEPPLGALPTTEPQSCSFNKTRTCCHWGNYIQCPLCGVGHKRHYVRI